MERLAKDKHSSPFGPFASYEEKKSFVNAAPADGGGAEEERRNAFFPCPKTKARPTMALCNNFLVECWVKIWPEI